MGNLNFSNLNNSYYNPSVIRLEDIIKDVCNSWSGITYDSNMVYLQIFFYLFLILTIIDFWNPYIDYTKVWKTKIFGKEIKVNIIDRHEYLSEFIIRLFIVYLFSKIVYVSYVQYFLVQKISILEFVLRLIGL